MGHEDDLGHLPAPFDAAVHRAVQQAYNEYKEEHVGSPAILMGWVLIAEYTDGQGRKWLQRASGAGMDGQEAIPSWTMKGYISEALEDQSWANLPTQQDEED